MIETIKKALENYQGTWQEKNGVWEFKALIAERKVFLSTKKLTYSAKIKIEEPTKTVKFSEMLSESGFGLTSGASFDTEISPGFGFKKETYNTLKGPREGNIEEQSTLFGKTYQYKFDFKEIRSKVEGVVTDAGYQFSYQILPVK